MRLPSCCLMKDPEIEHCFSADRMLDPEQKFIGINKGHALVPVVECKQCHVVRRGDLEEKIDLRRDRNRLQEMIRAPKQAGVSRHRRMYALCPLFPQQRTLVEPVEMSALCQRRTSDHLVLSE